MGLKEKFGSQARETSKKITDKVIPNTHIGNHSIESLSQEVFSLRNTKPMFRDGKWKKQYERIEGKILEKISYGQNQFQALYSELMQIKEMR